MCKKCNDIITCVGSGYHLRPDRIEPGAPYFGKSLPVRHCHCLNFFGDVCFQGVYRSWFVLVNSPFQISPLEIIRHHQIRRAWWPKSLWKDAVTEKGLNFGYAGMWSVGCRFILLEISNWEFLIVQLIYNGVEDFHICSCCDGCIEEDGTNYATLEHPTPNINLLWMKGFFMYHVGIFTCPNTGILRINISRQVKPFNKLNGTHFTNHRNFTSLLFYLNIDLIIQQTSFY